MHPEFFYFMSVLFRIIILILTLSAVSCTKRQPHPQLTKVAELSDDNPEEASDSLAAVDYSGLSEPDRHLYDFLSVKVYDKSYVRHTSDSLILDVIDYYSSHKDADIYPQAIYYGGRVYSDLGDFPTALRYFQQALDITPDDETHLNFRGNILSQTGGLLNELHLSKEAIPYIEKSIEVDTLTNKVFGLAYDYRLLGTIYYNMMEYEKAESYYREGIKYASLISPTDSADITLHLADIECEKGNVDSALALIRDLTSRISSSSKNLALAIASDVYLSAGISDTAYMYAKELVKSKDANNRMSGYRALLSPELYGHIPTDSLRLILIEYRNFLMNYLDRRDTESVLLQNSFYNYQKHVRERDQAKASHDKVILYFVVLSFLFILLCLFLLYQKYRNSLHIIQLHKALATISELQAKLDSEKMHVESCNPPSDRIFLLRDTCENQSLQEHLLDMLNEIQNSTFLPKISDSILQSKIYAKLRDYIKHGKGITSTKIWEEIAETVEQSSPGFKSRLEKVMLGRLLCTDYETALLIRCGFTPSEMSLLLNKTKGTISSRRVNLSKKIFGQNIGTKAIDNIIRLL